MVEAKKISKTADKPANNGLGKAKAIPTKGLDFIIVGSIALVLFFSPIFFTGLVAQGIGFEKMILFYFLVLIGIVAWVTKGVILGELDLKRTPLDIPILATIVIFAISTILSVSGKDSLIGAYGNSAKGLTAVIIFALFYYLVINNINARRIKILFWWLVASSSLVVIYSLLQLKGWYILPIDFTHTKSFNPLGSLSGLTMFLVIVFPVLTIAATQTKEILGKGKEALALPVKAVVGLVSLGLLIILALLNGFTFWPIAIVGMVIVLMFFLAKIIRTSSNNLLIPLGGFLALIILLVLGNFNLVDLKLPAEVSLSRGASWNIAKSALADNPIFGSGPSTFGYSFAKFKSMDFNASPLWNIRFDSSTGIIYELMATVGALGLIAVGVLMLIGLSIAFLTLIKNKEEDVNAVMLALFASFISASLYAILFPQNNSLLLVTMVIAIFSVSSALVMYPERFKTLRLSFRASAKYALALAAIFLCVSAGVVVVFTMGLKMYLGDIYARQSLVDPKIENKIEKLNKSITLAPYQDGYYISLANNYMALANKAALAGGDQANVAQYLGQAIESGKKAVEIAPNKAGNNESLALIYENASFYTRGALEWSEDLYNKVIELDPNNPTPYLRIALVNMARANAETDEEEQKFYIGEAIKKYDQAIEKKSDLAAAYYGKAIASERLTNIDDAIEQLKKANLISRNNLDYRFELGRLYFNRGVTKLALNQTASQQIAENDIAPEEELAPGEEGEPSQEELSVEPSTPPPAGLTARNTDLNTAEQLFLSILLANPNHANSRYSLAVLYQKVGEQENARVMVKSLLDIVQDEQTKNAIKQQFPGLY